MAQVEASLDRIDALFADFNRSLERICTSSIKLSSDIYTHSLSPPDLTSKANSSSVSASSRDQDHNSAPSRDHTLHPDPLHQDSAAATPPLPLTPNPTSSASSLCFPNKPTQPSATDINFAEGEQFVDSDSTSFASGSVFSCDPILLPRAPPEPIGRLPSLTQPPSPLKTTAPKSIPTIPALQTDLASTPTSAQCSSGTPLPTSSPMARADPPALCDSTRDSSHHQINDPDLLPLGSSNALPLASGLVSQEEVETMQLRKIICIEVSMDDCLGTSESFMVDNSALKNHISFECISSSSSQVSSDGKEKEGLKHVSKNKASIIGMASLHRAECVFTIGVKMPSLNSTYKVDPTQCSQAARRNVANGFDPKFVGLGEEAVGFVQKKLMYSKNEEVGKTWPLSYNRCTTPRQEARWASSHWEISNLLKLIVKEVDLDTVEAEEGGVENEYQLEDFQVVAADYMLRVSVLNFKNAWESMGPDCERIDKYGLGVGESLAEAITAIINILGMQPCEGTDVVPNNARSHTCLLSGVFIGNVKVLVRLSFRFDGPKKVVMKLAVRSEDEAISDAIHEIVAVSDVEIDNLEPKLALRDANALPAPFDALPVPFDGDIWKILLSAFKIFDPGGLILMSTISR
ncbi:hypothetical protein IEQ34_009085 [Dendrobium chrysotoxum]|uniref:Coatomer subunit gamma C-terminal domain-containing protein n=1 Tax=Dendrobium chrysotoxum TaxID=161865 RepID=A0AAV7H1Y4_DENCH|nr:hypothetical protein IEQ34_009085 [Dendrobium chrysotoxum]